MRPDDAAKMILEALNAVASTQTGSFIAYDGSSIEW
jgi:hypothetical protein